MTINNTNIQDIELAAKGDTEAFRRIYDLHSSFVYTLCYRILENAEEAKDCAQDVFVAVYKSLHTFDHRSSFKTWLYRVSVNHALTRVKKVSVHRMRTQPLEDQDVGAQPESPETTRQIVDQTQISARLSSMLACLDEASRSCLLLREIEGMAYEQISAELSINVSTVKTKVRRAWAKLLEKKRGEL